MLTCVFEFRSCGEFQTASQEKHVIQKLETMDVMRMHADGFASLCKNIKGENTFILKDFCIESFLYSGSSSGSQ